ncbi:MAG: SH3 domain-containing protein [Xanthobacteraceae bacterium]
MDIDKPDGQGRSRLAEFVAVVALLAVGGGFFIYQHGIPSDVSSELARKSASSAPGTERGIAPGGVAGATSNSPSQQFAANAGASAPANQADQAASPESAAGAQQNGQSKSASLPTNDIAYVQKRRANIRSEPNERGPLAGRAYKGTKLSVLNRSGKWVQVESGETKGWVSARLLGPRLP